MHYLPFPLQFSCQCTVGFPSSPVFVIMAKDPLQNPAMSYKTRNYRDLQKYKTRQLISLLLKIGF